MSNAIPRGYRIAFLRQHRTAIWTARLDPSPAPEAERLSAFEHMLAEMAALFLSCPAEAIDGPILSSRERLAHFLGIESACRFSISVRPGTVELFLSALDGSALDDSPNPDEESVSQ